MQSARETIKNKPQLDPEWLLGPRSLGREAVSAFDVPSTSAPAPDLKNPPGRSTALRTRRSILLRCVFGLALFSMVALGALLPWHRILDTSPFAKALRLPPLSGSESAEDTLRTMLELSAAVTQSNADLVDQLSHANTDHRTAAFQSLCARIQCLGTNRAAISQRIALVQLLQTVPTDAQEVSQMRGLLASQLLQGLALNDPAIQSTRQALIAMLEADFPLDSDYDPAAPTTLSTLSKPTVRVLPVDRSLRIAGMEQLPLRVVFSLTQSQQAKRVDAAIAELRRRGFDASKIETLFELARGNAMEPSQLEQRVNSVFGHDAPSVLEWLSPGEKATVGTSASDVRSLAQSSHAAIAQSAWLTADASSDASQWPDHVQNKDPQR